MARALELGLRELSLDLLDARGRRPPPVPPAQPDLGPGSGGQWLSVGRVLREPARRAPGPAPRLRPRRRLPAPANRGPAAFQLRRFLGDTTAPDDRFFLRRTGIDADLRIRPRDLTSSALTDLPLGGLPARRLRGAQGPPPATLRLPQLDHPRARPGAHARRRTRSRSTPCPRRRCPGRRVARGPPRTSSAAPRAWSGRRAYW